MKRMLLIFRRELKELRRNRTFFQTMALLPVIFVLLPVAIVLFFNVDISNFAAEHSPGPPGDCTALAGLKACDKAGIIAQLLAISFSFFLPVPVVLPILIASYSVIGEKDRKSLEPLLATPIRTWELLVGKALSAVVPTLALYWFTFGAVLVILRLMLPDVVFDRLNTPLWIMVMLGWGLGLAFVTTMFGVVFSARANDARAAQQSGSLLALPVVGIVLGITFGLFELNWLLWGIGVAVLLVLALVSYRLATIMFQRENILTRWK